MMMMPPLMPYSLQIPTGTDPGGWNGWLATPPFFLKNFVHVFHYSFCMFTFPYHHAFDPYYRKANVYEEAN